MEDIRVGTLKKVKGITLTYAIATLLVHLTALSAVIVWLEAIDRKIKVNQALLSRMDEVLSAVFVALCFLFMITAAVLLLINRICAIDYLRMQEIFWLTQFVGYWIFRLIMKQITEYVKMDLYWRFIKVFGYDLTPCLLLLPPVIWLGFKRFRKRK